jgi:hypothetical protein
MLVGSAPHPDRRGLWAAVGFGDLISTLEPRQATTSGSLWRVVWWRCRRIAVGSTEPNRPSLTPWGA